MSGNAKYQQGVRGSQMLKALKQNVPGNKRKSLDTDEETFNSKNVQKQPSVNLSRDDFKDNISEKCLGTMSESKNKQKQLVKCPCDDVKDTDSLFFSKRKKMNVPSLYHEFNNKPITLSKNDMDLLFSVSSTATLPQVKSVSTSDLTQDTEGLGIYRRCLSDLVIKEHNDDFLKKAWLWCVPYSDNNSSSQNHIESTVTPNEGNREHWTRSPHSDNNGKESRVTLQESFRESRMRSPSLSPSLLDGVFHKNFNLSLPLNNINNNDLTTDSESNESQVYYGDLEEGRKRRRKAKPSEWSKNKSKQLRMKGEQYIGYCKPAGERATHDILRPARQLGETCKSEFCKKSKLRGCAQFTEETRNKIHSRFRKTLNWDQRKILVNSLVTRATTNRMILK